MLAVRDLPFDLGKRAVRLGILDERWSDRTFRKYALSSPSASVARTFPVTVQALVPNGAADTKVEPAGRAGLGTEG